MITKPTTVVQNGCGQLILTAAWQKRAAELARWAIHSYFIRRDVWGGYNAIADRDKEIKRPDGSLYKLGTTCTQPAKSKRGIVTLTEATVVQHFRGARPEHVIGAHTTSITSMSKFGTAELDVHGNESNDPSATSRAALAWYAKLVARGHRPLLWDSNGKGGYHLDVLLADPVPTPHLFRYLRTLVADYAAYGLPVRPETFPKQPQLNPRPDGKGAYGNWVRLPGRHHTRPHWATVWNCTDWLPGDAAIDYMLGLTGDDPALIPAVTVDMLAHRIEKYIAKMPTGMSEGQGRDDRAYTLAAFLVRDLNLSDADALPWLRLWDQKQAVFKGDDRLNEIIANAHSYAQHAYGSGLNSTPPSQVVNPELPASSKPQRGLETILADFRVRLKPKFRRGQAVFSESLGREVKPSEGCFAPDVLLVQKLTTAADAPKDGNGQVDPKRIPKFYREWVRSAWAEMLIGLPEEVETAEVVETAEQEFRRAVCVGLLEQVTLGERHHEQTESKKKKVVVVQERRSFIEWADRFAKPGRWESIRSYPIWCCREDGAKIPRVAVRVELFARIRLAGLSDIGHRKFVALATLYGVGQPGECRAGGQRCLELTQTFLAEVLDNPNQVDDDEANSLARVREKWVLAATS